MRIHLSDPALVDDLVRFLKQCELPSQHAGSGAVEASPEREQADPALARLQLDGFLRVWCAMHAGADAHFDG
jgi:hypothetical protein